jgi:hypothetical protein
MRRCNLEEVTNSYQCVNRSQFVNKILPANFYISDISVFIFYFLKLIFLFYFFNFFNFDKEKHFKLNYKIQYMKDSKKKLDYLYSFINHKYFIFKRNLKLIFYFFLFI